MKIVWLIVASFILWVMAWLYMQNNQVQKVEPVTVTETVILENAIINKDWTWELLK